MRKGCAIVVLAMSAARAYADGSWLHRDDGAAATPPLSVRAVMSRSGPKADGPTTITASASQPFTTVRVGIGDAAALSGDGRFVAFSGGDGFIYVYDRTTGATSRETAGLHPVLSHDGRFLAFTSTATDLVPGVGGTQVYVRDRALRSTVVASASNSGGAGNAGSLLVSISGDARVVLFVSSATNLVAGDTSGERGAFTRDLQLGETRRESVDSDGRPVTMSITDPIPAALSGNGRYVAFVTPPLSGRVLVRDRTTGQVTIEQTPNQGFLSNGSPSLSDDGRWVSFTIVFLSLAPGSASSYVRDRVTGAVDVVPQGGRSSTLSGDGRFVSYSSSRQFPAAAAVVWDRITGQVTELGVAATGSVGVSRVAGDAVAFGVDGVIYVAAAGQAPSAPTNLTVALTGSTLTLTWAAATTSGTPTVYVIEAGTSSGGTDVAIFSTGSNVTRFSAAVSGGGTYYVRVRAANAAGISPPSSEVVVALGPVPGAPVTLAASVSGSTVTLTWLRPTTGAVSSYIIEAGSAPGLTDRANFNTASTATTLTSSVPAGTYFVRVRAANLGGVGPSSNEIVVTTSLDLSLSAPGN